MKTLALLFLSCFSLCAQSTLTTGSGIDWGKSPSNPPSEWADRVVSNGGARPSGNSVNASNAFLVGLTNDSLRSKLFYVNFIAPDSLAAALTPVIRPTTGSFTSTTDFPANNANFVLGDLTVDGIKGDASTKEFHTGTSMNVFSTTSASLIVYTFTAGTAGFEVAVQLQSSANRASLYTKTNSTIGSFFDFSEGNGQKSLTANVTNGYYCSSRTAANTWTFYYANSLTAHASIGTSAGAGGSITDSEMFVMAMNFINPVPAGAFFCDSRISFIAIGSGLSSSDSNNLFNRIQTLRTSLGGGFR